MALMRPHAHGIDLGKGEPGFMHESGGSNRSGHAG